MTRACVTDTGLQRSRDPRFSSLSGSAHNKALFKASYGFLRDVQASEVGDLKRTLSSLVKLERNHAGPKAKSERAQEIREEKQRVEEALRRAEGLENERKRREREDAVLGDYKREQRSREKAGGRAYHLKDCKLPVAVRCAVRNHLADTSFMVAAKRALVLQDKYERLAGGQGANATPIGSRGAAAPNPTPDRSALRKALERRRKKNAQKERRHMPGFVDRANVAPSGVKSRERKREAARAEGARPHKRGRS